MASQEKPVISYSLSSYQSEVFYMLDGKFIEASKLRLLVHGMTDQT